MLACSNLSESCLKILMTRREAIEYNDRVPRMKRAGPKGWPGHRRQASEIGIADRTPYSLAA